MRLLKADFYVIKIILWVGCFFGFSFLMGQYENIMNYIYTYGEMSTNQILFTGTGGQMVSLYAHMNLLNEGIIGYALLSAIGISAFMFCREFLSLQKEVQSLVHSERLEEGVKKFV